MRISDHNWHITVNTFKLGCYATLNAIKKQLRLNDNSIFGPPDLLMGLPTHKPLRAPATAQCRVAKRVAPLVAPLLRPPSSQPSGLPALSACQGREPPPVPWPAPAGSLLGLLLQLLPCLSQSRYDLTTIKSTETFHRIPTVFAVGIRREQVERLMWEPQDGGVPCFACSRYCRHYQ